MIHGNPTPAVGRGGGKPFRDHPTAREARCHPKGCGRHARDPSVRNGVPYTSPRQSIYFLKHVYRVRRYGDYIYKECVCKYSVWLYTYATLAC
jgi:hypothetical protein